MSDHKLSSNTPDSDSKQGKSRENADSASEPVSGIPVVRTPQAIVRLQRLIGNQSVQRLLRADPNRIARSPASDTPYAESQSHNDKAVLARDAAETGNCSVEELQTHLNTVNTAIETITRHVGTVQRIKNKDETDTFRLGKMNQMKDRVSSAQPKVENALKAKKGNLEALQESNERQRAARSDELNTTSTLRKMYNFLETVRKDVGKVVSASAADAIKVVQTRAANNLSNSSKALLDISSSAVNIGSDLDRAENALDKAVGNTRSIVSESVSAIKKSLEVVKEAQAVATIVHDFVTRGAGHVDEIAKKKLDSLTKNEEAKKAKEDAEKAKTTAEETAQKLVELQAEFEKAQKTLNEATSTVSDLEKVVQKAEISLQGAQSFKAAVDSGYEVEQYMVDGANDDVLKATQSLSEAKQKLAEAKETLAKAQETFDTAQSELETGDKQNTEATEKSTVAQETAKSTREESEKASSLSDLTVDTHTKANTDDIAEDEALEELRNLAGGQLVLEEFYTFTSDRTLLKTLLKAIGAEHLLKLLKDPNIGLVKTQGFHTSFGGSCGAIITAMGINRTMDMIKTFEMDVFKRLYDEITLEKLKNITLKWSVATFKKRLDEMTIDKYIEWQKEITAQQMGDLYDKLTWDKLKLFIAAFTITEFKPYIEDFTADQILDFTTKFTPTELKVYVADLTYTKLKELVNTRQLKADALHKYTSAWLKTFVGVGPTTMGHIQGIGINGANKISGGHDKGVFEGYLNTVIGGGGQKRGVINSTNNGDPIENVYYTLYNPNGSIRGTANNYKTIVKGLVTNSAAWEKRLNDALWVMIKNLTFPTAGGTFGNGTYEYKYYNGGTEVESAYPR